MVTPATERKSERKVATENDLTNDLPRALGGQADSIRNVEDLLNGSIAYANSLLHRTTVDKRSMTHSQLIAALDDRLPVDKKSRLSLRRKKRTMDTIAKALNIAEDEIHTRIFTLLSTACLGKAALINLLAAADWWGGDIGVNARPVWEIHNREITIDWRIAGNDRNPIALVRFALVSLASRTAGDALPIGRCSLDSCGRFFIIKKNSGEAGRLRTKYCSSEHMRAAHQANSLERVRRSRERRAKLNNRRIPK